MMIGYHLTRFRPDPPIPRSTPVRLPVATGVKVYVVERADKPVFYFRWQHPTTGKWLSRASNVPKDRPKGDATEEREKLERALAELYRD